MNNAFQKRETNIKLRKIAVITVISLISVVFILFALVWVSTYHPNEIQSEPVISTGPAPLLQTGQKIKILVWNVQFMAGKNYVFWYDVPGWDGPDECPSSSDIKETFSAVAKVIIDENPDIILIQELDIGASRTDCENQLHSLLSMLPDEYGCSTSAFYWKASFIPHPRIMGSVGLSMATISKFKITSAKRHQLALAPNNWLVKQMNTKRAMLESHLPLKQGGEFVVLNTHLEAYADSSNVMKLQVTEVDSLLTSLTSAGLSWIIGGDFNLLPPNINAYRRLPKSHQKYYNPISEIKILYEKYQAIPGLQEISGTDYPQWFTHFSNDPDVVSPDRTIDYIFYSNNMQSASHYIRKYDTQHISDHLPLIAEFTVP